MTQPNDEISLTTAEAAALQQSFRYCPRCRTDMIDRLAFGRVRRVCPDCNFVQFIDPKVAAAVLAEQNGKVLLVRRVMEPGQGQWCFPGGFVEIGETPQQSAIRECQEESGYLVEIERLLDVFYYEDYRGSGVIIMYHGWIIGGTPRPGEDASDVGLFGPDDLPEIAFDSNKHLLNLWLAGKIDNDQNFSD